VLELAVDTVVPLIRLADAWDLPRVRGLCDRWMRRHVAPDNAFVLFAASRLYGCDGLAIAARDFICINSKAVRTVGGLRLSVVPFHPDPASLLEEIFEHMPTARL